MQSLAIYFSWNWITNYLIYIMPKYLQMYMFILSGWYIVFNNDILWYTVGTVIIIVFHANTHAYRCIPCSYPYNIREMGTIMGRARAGYALYSSISLTELIVYKSNSFYPRLVCIFYITFPSPPITCPSETLSLSLILN